MRNLDLDLLRSFVCVAEAKNFTGAGAILGATQSAMSVRIKKLEEHLGKELLERSPRHVRPTPFGAQFLADAKKLLALHDETLGRAMAEPMRAPLALGVSDHAAGGQLVSMLAHLERGHPGVSIGVSVAPSDLLEQEFAEGQYDAVIIRRPLTVKETGKGGKRKPALKSSAQKSQKKPERGDEKVIVLFREKLEWVAAPDFTLPDLTKPETVIPLIVMADPCQLRRLAIGTLERAGLKCAAHFSGRGIWAIQAAVMAGLGIACLDQRSHPEGARVLKAKTGHKGIGEREIDKSALGRALPGLAGGEMVMKLRNPATAQGRIMQDLAHGLKYQG